MNTYRKNAIIAGVLFIIGTVAGLLEVFTGPVLDAANFLTNVSAKQNQVRIEVFLALITAFACAGIAIWLYPVLKKHNEALALGSVGFRIIENVLSYSCCNLPGVTIAIISGICKSRSFICFLFSNLGYFIIWSTGYDS